MFFSFLAVFPLPESYQNDPKFHFNTLLRSDTQKSSKNVENTTVFWSRCETVFGPPAKADIATAILTNVIEHLVLLFPPNKHAFTAKAVWADFFVLVYTHSRSKYTIVLVRLRQNFSSASRAALYEKLRTCKAMLRRERQEKVEMKDDSQAKSMHFSHVGSYFIGTGECATHDANVHELTKNRCALTVRHIFFF